MMNCDQVFDILTRGPFPTGDMSDLDVEMHLQTCGACRRLAEALRPAVELFDESVEPHETGSLPGYWGLLAEELQEPPRVEAETAEPRNRLVSLAARHEQPRRRRAVETRQPQPALNRNAVRLALAVLLGVAIGGLLRVAGVEGPNQSGDQVAAGDTDARYRPAPQSGWEPTLTSDVRQSSRPTNTPVAAEASLSPLAIFHKFDLRAGCLADPNSDSPAAPSDEETMLLLASLNKLQCCTHCHHASQSQAAPPAASLFNVVASCATCHETVAGAASPSGR